MVCWMDNHMGYVLYTDAVTWPKEKTVNIDTTGWILSCTAGIFANAMQIQSYIILFKEGYNYERWHTSLVRIL